jgi:predicted dehydrogenase
MSDSSFQNVIRVGWVGTGPFSFYSAYLPVINNIYRQYNPLNMRVTHIWGDDYSRNYGGRSEWVKQMTDVWNRGEQSANAMAEKCNIPTVCNDFHEMVDSVDAAMIMDFDRSYELAEPFLRKGLPVFLCSPVAVNVPECEKLLDLAADNGCAVFTGSFTAYMWQIQLFNTIVKRQDVAAFFASTTCHFYSSYANDGLEPLYWLIGSGIRNVALHGWDGSHGYDPHFIPDSHIHLEYEPRNGRPQIQGMLNLGGFKKEMEWYKIYYQDHSIQEFTNNQNVLAGTIPELAFHDFLVKVQEAFITNTSPETPDDIIRKLKVVIAAYKSANEGNRVVSLDEVGDYRLPTVRIEQWDKIPGK